MQPDLTPVLDREQLRDVTLNDPALMREIMSMLLDDTSQQIAKLDLAIRQGDSPQCARLAHYSKGACLNVGASRVGGMFRTIETKAMAGELHECAQSLAALARELDLLKSESTTL